MKLSPAVKLSAILSASLLAIVLVGCSTFGTNPTPPTALESHIFTVVTNYVPVTQTVTNYATNVVVQTVQQTITNLSGVSQVITNFSTNTIVVPSPGTVTNLQAQYNYTPGPAANAVTAGVSAIPVYGTIASAAIPMILGIWGWIRSTKNKATAVSGVQIIQTMRQFIQALPNGATYDTALTNWMQQHQADAGVLNNTMALIASEVSNNDAQFAANSVIATINGLSATPPIPTPPAPAIAGAVKV